MTYTCAYCAQQLDSIPIRTGEDLAFPCSNCGALNLFPNIAGIAKAVAPHVLCHTFSVSNLKKGVSLRTLQYLPGHDQITTTEIYMPIPRRRNPGVLSKVVKVGAI